MSASLPPQAVGAVVLQDVVAVGPEALDREPARRGAAAGGRSRLPRAPQVPLPPPMTAGFAAGVVSRRLVTTLTVPPKAPAP